MGLFLPAGRSLKPRDRLRGEATDTLEGREGPIREVARRILSGWDEATAGWLAQKEEVELALERIAREVELIRSGSEPDASRTPPSRPLLDHRLCESVRVELLQDWQSARRRSDPDGSAESLVDVLTAIEEYRRFLLPGGGEELASQLAQPDAFELVVELAHDLRSPLNSILFMSEVLRSGHSGPISDHQARQLGLVYSATLGMISVVNDVMELASEQRGAFDEEPGPFSIGSVFESVGKMVGPMAEEKSVALEFRPPDYDRCLGHPGPIARVLLNLTTNALKFTDEGWVRVSAEMLGRSVVEFSVTDTGRGMEEDEIARLFQAFRKATNRSGYFFSGSGLGLSIARRLLVAMDSELMIDSKPGEGSRFHFRLQLPTVPAV